MRFPDFVPVVENERKRRQIVGVLLEMGLWGYFCIFLGKVLVTLIALPYIETLAYRDTPVTWAEHFIKWLNFDSRYFEFPLSWFSILFLIGCVIGLGVSVKCKGVGSWIASLSRLQVKNAQDSLLLDAHWRYAKIEAIVLVICTVLTGWVVTQISFSKIFDSDGLLGASRLGLQLACGVPGVGSHVGGLGSLYELIQWGLNLFICVHNHFASHPVALLNIPCEPNDLSYFMKALNKLAESVYLAFMATFFSIPIAFVLSFFAARNLTRHSALMRFLYALVRSYMNITRSIEPLIWAILFSVWIGIGPFAGSLALLVHSVSSLVKQYSEAVEGVDAGPLEAIQATGASRVAVVWFAVVPQVALPFLAFTIYRWDINVRMATIIGLVGGGGIGSILIQEQMLARWTQVGSLAFLIFLVVWGMDFLSARIREAIQ